MNDSTCLRVDCCHESRVSHRGVVLLSHLLKFHSSVRLLCQGIPSQHHHPLAFSMLMVFRGSLTNLFVTCLDEQFLVTENDFFLGDMGVHSRADGSRVRISNWVQTMRSRGVTVGFTHTKCSLAPKEILMLVVTCQSQLDIN